MSSHVQIPADETLAAAPDASRQVKLHDILSYSGLRSFAVTIFAGLIVLLVAPQSFGATIAGGLIIALAGWQMLCGKSCLQLPRFLANLRIRSKWSHTKLSDAQFTLAKNHIRRPIGKLAWLHVGPLATIPHLVLTLTALSLPLLVSYDRPVLSFGIAIAVYGGGLLIRDARLTVVAAIVLSLASVPVLLF